MRWILTLFGLGVVLAASIAFGALDRVASNTGHTLSAASTSAEGGVSGEDVELELDGQRLRETPQRVPVTREAVTETLRETGSPHVREKAATSDLVAVGAVLDAGGVPIERAEVSLRGHRGTPRTVMTASDGSFQIDVPRDPWVTRLVVRAPGFVTESLRRSRGNGATRVNFGEIRLERGRRLRGSVEVRPEGLSTWRGWYVSVLEVPDTAGGDHGPHVSTEAKIAADNTFEFADLRPDWHEVRLVHRGLGIVCEGIVDLSEQDFVGLKYSGPDPAHCILVSISHEVDEPIQPTEFALRRGSFLVEGRVWLEPRARLTKLLFEGVEGRGWSLIQHTDTEAKTLATTLSAGGSGRVSMRSKQTDVERLLLYGHGHDY